MKITKRAPARCATRRASPRASSKRAVTAEAAAARRAAKRQAEAQSQAANVAGALLRLPAVRLATGYGTSSIYQFIKDGRFPLPRKFHGASLWVKSEVEGWLAAVGENVDAHGDTQRK